jgi:hypothetical protein
VSGTVESGDHYSPSSRSSRAPGLPLGARNPRVAGAWLRLQAPSCCAVGGGGGSGSGTAAGAVMDAQQQLDLVMRHQSMATVCESEVQARLSLSLSLSLCSIVPRWQDSTFLFLVLIGVLVAARALLAVVWWLWLLQDALGSSESDPARPARPRGKRSRAAEVHNLSEKVGAGCVAGPCLSLLAPFRHWTVR